MSTLQQNTRYWLTEQGEAVVRQIEDQVRSCRSCGCTDEWACFPPCWWVEADLCSSCSTGQGRA